MPTPVSDGKLLYVVRDGGVVFALDVKTTNGKVSAAFAARHLQRIADSGRRQNLRHHRGGRDYHGLQSGAEVRDSVVELAAWRLCALLFEHLSRFPTGKSSSARRPTCGDWRAKKLSSITLIAAGPRAVSPLARCRIGAAGVLLDEGVDVRPLLHPLALGREGHELRVRREDHVARELDARDAAAEGVDDRRTLPIPRETKAIVGDGREAVGIHQVDAALAFARPPRPCGGAWRVARCEVRGDSQRSSIRNVVPSAMASTFFTASNGALRPDCCCGSGPWDDLAGAPVPPTGWRQPSRRLRAGVVRGRPRGRNARVS